MENIEKEFESVKGCQFMTVDDNRIIHTPTGIKRNHFFGPGAVCDVIVLSRFMYVRGKKQTFSDIVTLPRHLSDSNFYKKV